MFARVPLITSVAYLVSCVGVVAGYTPFPGIFEGFYWSLVARDLPLLTAAAANVASIYVVLFGAFWSSKGDREIYKNAVFGYSFFLPYLVVLIFLPGAQSKPDWASQNHGLTIAAFFAVQFTASRALRDWFWLRGGRRDA